MKLSISLRRLCIAAIFLLTTGASNADLAIIAHPDNPEPALTLKQVKRIYLAKSKKFPQGGVVRRADQEAGQPARQIFTKKVLKLREKQLNTYWSKMTFTGRGIRPEVVGKDADIKHWIMQHPNGLGYIDAAQVDDKVKVLLIVP